MKRLLLTAAVAVTACAGLTGVASAQSYARGLAPGGVQPGTDFGRQLDALESRLRAGIGGGSVDRGEANRALGALASIRRDLDAARRDGLPTPERVRLQERLDHLSRSIHWMRETPTGGPYGRGAPASHAAWNAGRFWNGAPPGPYERIGWLRQRIQHAVDNRALDRRDAARVTGDLRSIEVQARQLTDRDHGSLNGPDRAYLQDRLDRLSRSLHWDERRDF